MMSRMRYISLSVKFLRAWPFVVAACVGCGAVDAQVVHEQSIVGQDRDDLAGSSFGRTIALDGDYIVVGAQSDQTHGLGSGAVYVFDADTKRQLHKLMPQSAAAHDIFGSAVGIKDGVLVIGASHDNVRGDDSGSAYLFDASTGDELHKFKADDGHAHALFGYAVAISDGIVAIGAPGDRGAGVQREQLHTMAAGSVYLFDAETHALRGKLHSKNEIAHNSFGIQIALGDGLIAVGSKHLVQVFDLESLEHLADIRSESNSASNLFGQSIAIVGEEVLVNATERVRSSYSTGVVLIYNARTGEQTGVLKPSDHTSDNFFGTCMRSCGDLVVIAAPGDRTNGHNAGAAYLFEVPMRKELAKLLPADGVEFMSFSRFAVATTDSLAAVSAYDFDTEQGTVYLFDVPTLQE